MRFNAGTILVEGQYWYYLTHKWRIRERERVHTVPKGIRPRENITERRELELSFNDIAVQHVSHYTTGTTPKVTKCNPCYAIFEEKQK